MARTHVLPNGFCKVRPDRAALVTCWALDSVVALALGAGTVMMVGLALTPFNVHHYIRGVLMPAVVM